MAVHGPVLRHLRTAAGHTVRTLAAETGMSYSSLSRVECGILRARPEMFAALAKALNVDPQVLMAYPDRVAA